MAYTELLSLEACPAAEQRQVVRRVWNRFLKGPQRRAETWLENKRRQDGFLRFPEVCTFVFQAKRNLQASSDCRGWSPSAWTSCRPGGGRRRAGLVDTQPQAVRTVEISDRG